MSRRRLFVKALGCAVFLTAQPLAGQIPSPELRSVAFEGNETFPDDSLARAIVTRKTECRTWLFTPFCALGLDFALSRAQLRLRDLPRDSARLVLWYGQRGFRDVQVDTPQVTRTSTHAEVVFRVHEGRPIVADSIAFTGDEDFTGSEVLEDLPLHQGDRLSTLTVDATRDTIIRRLNDTGYAYAEVLLHAISPAEDPYNAIVTFEILPGPETRYGDVIVEGNENLGLSTVLRTAQLTSGEVYRRSEIEEARARLYGLDIIRNANVTPDTTAFAVDPVVDVNITLQEGDAYRVRAGGGWSNAECLAFEARWAARNFLGGGRLLQLRARVGNLLADTFRDPLCLESGVDEFGEPTGLAAVDFFQPWIFSTRNSLSASLFAERQSLPDVFVRRAVGIQGGLSRSVSPQTLLTGYYRPELSQLDADDVLFCTGFLVCSPTDVAALEGANWLSPVGINLTRDRSDDLLNPRRGYRVLLDVEHAAPWTLSDFRYDRVLIEGSRYDPVGGSVFATRVRGGWVGAGGFDGLLQGPSTARGEEIVHPQKRFYTGGASSVRGFSQSRLGPRVLFASPGLLLSSQPQGGACTEAEVQALTCTPADGTALDPQATGGTRLLEANAELRFPLGSLAEGVVFTDVGQAWGADESIELEQLEFTPGVGLRFGSPVGPIRVDLAYRFRGAQELSVVTEQIRPFDSTIDVLDDQLIVGATRVPWVSTGQLVFLDTPFLFGVNDAGLQLHVSIGQAF